MQLYNFPQLASAFQPALSAPNAAQVNPRTLAIILKDEGF